MNSIILILQLVIALLNTPNLTPAQQAQVTQLANEAVAIVSSALAQPATDSSTIPTVTPGPDVSVQAPALPDTGAGTGTEVETSTPSTMPETQPTSTPAEATSTPQAAPSVSVVLDGAFVTVTNPSN